MLNDTTPTKRIARAGIIAGVYALLSLLFHPISYGALQVRISEGLTLLPLLFPEAIWGLTIGCLISNLFGNGLLDVIFGTLATLVAALLTHFVCKKIENVPLKIIIGGLFPVIINAIVVPFTYLAINELAALYFINLAQVGIGQAISVFAIGTPTYLAIKKAKKN